MASAWGGRRSSAIGGPLTSPGRPMATRKAAVLGWIWEASRPASRAAGGFRKRGACRLRPLRVWRFLGRGCTISPGIRLMDANRPVLEDDLPAGRPSRRAGTPFVAAPPAGFSRPADDSRVGDVSGEVCGCLPPGPRRAATTTGTPHGTPRTSYLGVGNDGVVSAEVRGGRAWVRGRAKVVAVVRDRPRAPRGLCRGTCCGLPVAFPPDGMCRWGPPGALRAEGPSLSVRPVRPISMRNWRPRQGSMPRTRSSLTPTLPDPDARKRCSQSARGPSGPASFSGRL